jgi:hypothetical protein
MVKLPVGWSRARSLFDDENLVSCAGLVPVMGLAEQAGLSELMSGKVAITATAVRSAGVNPVGKVTSVVAGMAAGADSVDDLDGIRSGGMPRLFGEVYAPATLGQLPREFTHGHGLRLASVARAHLVNLVARTGLLPGIETQARGRVHPRVCLNNRKVCSRSKRRGNTCHNWSISVTVTPTPENHSHNGFGWPSPGSRSEQPADHCDRRGTGSASCTTCADHLPASAIRGI